MCGATSAQTTAQQQQAQFYQTLQQQYSTVFGEDQGILQSLKTQLAPIIAAGPSQTGFSQGEVNALSTGAKENTAQNYGQAEQALQQDQAAAGGGNDYLPSGGMAEQRGQLAGMAASTEASAENQIQMANYQQGNQNYNTALSGELGVSAQLNPEGMAGQTTGAGEASSNTAYQIAQSSNSVWGSVLGALGGVGGMAAGGYLSKH